MLVLRIFDLRNWIFLNIYQVKFSPPESILRSHIFMHSFFIKVVSIGFIHYVAMVNDLRLVFYEHGCIMLSPAVNFREPNSSFLSANVRCVDKIRLCNIKTPFSFTDSAQTFIVFPYMLGNRFWDPWAVLMGGSI